MVLRTVKAVLEPLRLKNKRNDPGGLKMHPHQQQHLVTAWSQGPRQECPATLPTHARCPAPAAHGVPPHRVVLPEGNEQCSGKSAPKPQPAHILTVGSHQSLFTGLFLALKDPVLPRLSRAEQASSQQSASDSSDLPLLFRVRPQRTLRS